MKHFTAENYLSFTKAYMVCALWSSTDSAGNPLDNEFSEDDFNASSWQKCILTCLRFLNEAAKVRELGGILWRVERDAHTNDMHASEQEQQNIKVDSTVVNYQCTLEQLKQNTKTLLIKHGLLTTK